MDSSSSIQNEKKGEGAADSELAQLFPEVELVTRDCFVKTIASEFGGVYTFTPLMYVCSAVSFREVPSREKSHIHLQCLQLQQNVYAVHQNYFCSSSAAWIDGATREMRWSARLGLSRPAQ